uniref:PLAT domain-containing protein n=1 Tax=Tetraselmis chuii TaxID=63592 RepID=A0A7S1XAC2_9CHLO
MLWGKKTLRALTVNMSTIDDSGLKCRYKVMFHTGDAENASTRSSISFVIYGDLGESGKMVMKGSPSRFNRGQMDAMFFEHANIGEMYKIRLSLETHKPADWLCSLVEVLNLRTGMQSFFMPNGTLATTTGAERFKDIFAVGKRLPAGVVTYKVIVSTGNAKESNLSSVNTDISLEIQGSHRVISKLLQPEKDVMNFARGSIDVFDLECLSVGSIESAVVMLHPRKGRVKWDLKYVEIVDAKAMESLTKAGGGAAGDFASKLLGSSVYLENAFGVIDTKERTKRRIKRANYPRGFPSLEARMEDAQMQILGGDGPEGKSSAPSAPSLPKPSPLALLRLF